METNQIETQYINRSLELRLYPNAKQREYLSKAFGCSRFVFNKLLETSRNSYKEEKKHYNKFEYTNKIPDLKKEYPFLKEIDSNILQQANAALSVGHDKKYAAIKQHKPLFKKTKSGKIKECNQPKFKRKHDKQSFTCVNTKGVVKGVTYFSIKIDFENNLLKIPKLKSQIKFKTGDLRFEGVIKQVTIKRNKANHYFAKICYQIPFVKPIKKLDANKAVGIDYGLKTTLTFSNGEEINSLRFYSQSERKLKKLHHRFSKKITNSNKSWSKNKIKAAIKLVKCYEHVANQRKDYLHKLSRKIVDKYDYIFVEDLNLNAWKKLWGKKTSDIALSTLNFYLQYKTEQEGKVFFKIDKFTKTTGVCTCGFINRDLTLSDRTWICPCCCKIHDRDISAAKTILSEGFKQFKQSTVGSTGI